MAYRGSDDRWRGQERGGYGRHEGRHEGRYEGGYGDRDRWQDDDRGFFDRAGDEVRSWFGDEEAERRREIDRSRYEQEQGWGGDRESGYRRGSSDDYGNDRGRGGYDRDRRYAERYSGDYRSGGIGRETWGGSGFGGDFAQGRRFDRIDAGSTGTHGVHPMSSPATGSSGAGYGITPEGGYSRSSRYGGYGRSSGQHDPHYAQWRSRQMEELDRDYDEYRREHQSRFEQEFGTWRQKRQSQRQMVGRVTEHMEVVGADGQHVGTVDDVRGDRIILTRSDPSASGRHHSIPCGWVEGVDDKVRINKSAEEAQRAWRDEDSRRALFEREDQGSEGPHVLGRSFSGTY